MIIADIQKASFIDYPGKIACVLFCPYCNLRCPFCHNPELVFYEGKPLDEFSVLSFLQSRVGKLEAVVITGGEPTLQEDLADFIKKIKKLGYLVKLDTNGHNPDVVESILDIVDMIALDIKATCEKYKTFGGDCNKLKETLELLKAFKGELILRTIMYPAFVSKEDLEKMKAIIPRDLKYSQWQFNEFRAFKTLENYKNQQKVGG